MLRPGSSLALAAFCGVACVALFAGPSGGHGRKGSCGPISAQTEVADSAARVYRVPTGHGARGRLYNYYGCAVGNAKPRVLARSASALVGVRIFGCPGGGCRLVRALRLVGAMVGVIVELHGLDSVDGTLTVRGLVDGQVLHTVHTYAVVGADTLIGEGSF